MPIDWSKHANRPRFLAFEPAAGYIGESSGELLAFFFGSWSAESCRKKTSSVMS